MSEADFFERAAKWIWNNRNWLFSGGGLSIVALLIWIFRKALSGSKPPPIEITVSNQGPVGESTDVLAQRLIEQTEKRVAAEHREQGYTGQLAEKNARITELESAVEALARPTGDSAIDDRRERALALLGENKTDEAEEVFAELEEAETEKGAEHYKKAAEAARHLGAIAYLHDTQKALNAYTRAVELDPDDAVGWNQLGLIQMRVGNLDAAERAYQNVMKLGNKIVDQSIIAAAMCNLGNVYLIRGDLDKTEECLEKSLTLYKELSRKEGMALQYGNLGIVYRIRGDLDKAEEFFRKSLTLEEELGRKEGMADQYGNLGTVYLTRGDLDKAEEFFRESLALNKKLGRKEGMASQFGNLGNVHLIRGDLDKAEEYHRKSLALEEDLGRKEGVASDLARIIHDAA